MTKRVFIFYLIAFLYSWIVWTIGILSGSAMPPSLAVTIGGAGPVIAAALCLLFLYTKRQRIDYLKRFAVLRFSVPVIIILLLPFAAHLVSSRFIPQIAPAFHETGWTYLIFLFVFGPLPEELAWRGIAFDELARGSILKAQLIVAVLWAVWHLPMFFIDGSYQAQLGLFSYEFWFFFISIIPVSFLTGFVYLSAGRSILAAALFHYAVNLSGQLFASKPNDILIETIIYAAAVIIFSLKFRRIKHEY